MKQIKILIILFLITLSFQFVNAQTGSVRGFVYEEKTGEPVIFTNVFLKGTSYGASTDVNGYFSISKIKEGNYTLMVTYLGYDSLTVPIAIESGKIISKKLYLKQSAVLIEGVTVSADRQEMRTETRVSVTKVTPKEIKRLPAVGGEPDLAQYMQVIPGVVFTGDQGGQLYIRGGSPIQNKVLLDGMVIYNPFHSIGLFSVFDSDIIRNADVYTGGFGAEYGGRISSIMDITTRDGNKNRLSGKFSANTFGSKLLLEGPLSRASRKKKGATTSFILSGKTSYLEQSSKALYTYIDTAGLPFNFTDLYGKLSINGVNGSKINFFGFNFRDQVKYQAVSDLNWNTYGIGSNIILVPAGASTLIKANISYSDYEITLKEVDQKPRYSKINGFNLGLSFVYFIGKDELDYGIETLGFKTMYEFYSSVGRKLDDTQNTTDLAGYIKYKHVFGKKDKKDAIGNLLFEPSVRIQYYASLAEMSPEPRLGLKYIATDFLRVKFSGGLYSQNFISANSDRDVVNLFYGFLSGTTDLQDEFEGRELNSSLQRSAHLISGFEIDITKRLMLNIEGYYKQNTQLTSINRNKIYDDSGENFDKPDYYKKDFIVEVGDAYGVDFLLKYNYKRTYFWAVYSLGYVNRNDGEIKYNPHYDRRHNVNLVGSYTFGKHLNWEFSTRWNLGSGFPVTQTQGYYEKLPFTNGLNVDYTAMNGDLGILYADLNQGRLPYYHRLDATVKRTFEFSDYSKLVASFGITNMYNRENIFYFDRIKHERVNQLPFMPSIGASLTF